MVFAICTILPSVLGLRLLLHLNKEMKLLDVIINYLLLNLLTNFICIGVLVLLYNFDDNLVTYISNYASVTFKYILLAMVVSIALTIIFTIFIKYINLRIEATYEKKEVK
jgi:hypothetical protein